MTEELPKKDNQGSQHYGNADTSVLARYENGEIDIYTLVALLAQSVTPIPSLLRFPQSKSGQITGGGLPLRPPKGFQ